MKEHAVRFLGLVGRKVGLFAVIYLIASLALFAAIRAIPGDPVALRLKNPDPERVAQERTRLGLDEPVIGAMNLKRSITFNPDGDGRVKRVFFVVGNEARPQFHISILARIARLCATPEFLDAFSAARTNRDLYKTILKWDKRIGTA